MPRPTEPDGRNRDRDRGRIVDRGISPDGRSRRRLPRQAPVPRARRGQRELIAESERSAAARGARRVFVTSFTFQAPGFYERQGYREIFRWDGVPVEGEADVHLRKDL
jgi:hypothetical protein